MNKKQETEEVCQHVYLYERCIFVRRVKGNPEERRNVDLGQRLSRSSRSFRQKRLAGVRSRDDGGITFHKRGVNGRFA